MKQFNIIGDIHGRTGWRYLVDPSRVNVFVGDYFDPYDEYTFNELRSNFLEIIEFALKYPDTILLLGNHDLHYIHRDDYSRMDGEHLNEILNLFLGHIGLFEGVAVAIDDHILVSHAGVTKPWLDSTGYTGPLEPRFVADYCNTLLFDGYEEHSRDGVIFERGWFTPKTSMMRHFMFTTKANRRDVYGTTPTQGPTWVRPQTLAEYNAFDPKKVMQIVGHTQQHNLQTHKQDLPGIILTDCLGYDCASLHVDIYDDGTIKYNTNRYVKA